MIKKILFLLMLVVWQSGYCQQPTTYEYQPFYYQRASLFEVLPVDTCDIIMLGNSLTNGAEWSELFGMPNIKNRGISGDVIQGVYDRMQPLIDGQPAKIFLMIGVNDLSHKLSVDSIATAYGELVDMMMKKMPNTKIYLESLLPMDISYGRYKAVEGKEPEISLINQRLEAYAASRGLTWIDLYSSFADENGLLRKDLTNEGLHLMGSAYLLWRDILLPYITE